MGIRVQQCCAHKAPILAKALHAHLKSGAGKEQEIISRPKRLTMTYYQHDVALKQGQLQILGYGFAILENLDLHYKDPYLPCLDTSPIAELRIW